MEPQSPDGSFSGGCWEACRRPDRKTAPVCRASVRVHLARSERHDRFSGCHKHGAKVAPRLVWVVL